MVTNEGLSGGSYSTTPPLGLILPEAVDDGLAPDAGKRITAALLEKEGISDEHLLGALREFGFDTALGEQVYQRLARYENSVLQSWMSSGLIWEKIASLTFVHTGRAFRGRSVWSRQEGDELRLETVSQGLLELEAIVLKEWEPALGAGLKTYFTTRCLWIFLNGYKKLLRSKKVTWVVLEEMPPRYQPSPEDVVIARETAHEALSRLNREMQMILQFRAEEYTVREIAELVGITEKAVEGRLRRYYERNAREGFGEQ